MRLKLHQFDLTWPDEVPLGELRPWIANQISEVGEPVRWAITAIQTPDNEPSIRKLIVEAVLIIV